MNYSPDERMSIPKEQEEQGKGILKEASEEVGEGSLQGSGRYKCRRTAGETISRRGAGGETGETNTEWHEEMGAAQQQLQEQERTRG